MDDTDNTELETQAQDDLLLTDDLMPNDGEAFADPVQKREIDEQTVRDRVTAVGAEPLINDIFGWLNFEIARADSIDNINPDDPKFTSDEQMRAMKHYKNKLALLKTSLVNLMDRFEVPFDSETGIKKEGGGRAVG